MSLKDNWLVLGGGLLAAGLGYLAYREVSRDSSDRKAGNDDKPKKTAVVAQPTPGRCTAATPQRKSNLSPSTPASTSYDRGSPGALPFIYQPGGSSGSLLEPKLKHSHSAVAEEKFSSAINAAADDSGVGGSPVRKVPRVEYDEDDAAVNCCP